MLFRRRNTTVEFRKNIVVSAFEVARDDVAAYDKQQTTEVTFTGFDDEYLCTLFSDWMTFLLDKNLNIKRSSWSCTEINYLTQTRSIIKMSLLAKEKEIKLIGMLDVLCTLYATLQEAYQCTAKKVLGEQVWWHTSFQSNSTLNATQMLHGIRILGSQVRYAGPWKISDDVLLDFKHEDIKKMNGPIASQQAISVFVKSHGPGHGQLSMKVAHESISRLRAALAFATGVPLEGGEHLWAVTRPELFQKIEALRRASELPIRGLPFWPKMDKLHKTIQQEGINRIFGAFRCYEAALSQANENAALVFFVMAIEALTVPSVRNWKGSSKRFTNFLTKHCPAVLKSVMNHGNFVASFGSIRTMEDFANSLYALRSEIVHTGALSNITSFMGEPKMNMQMRIVLVAGVAQDAILRFLDEPKIFTHSSEQDQPKITIQPSKALFEKLNQVANSDPECKGIEQWLLKKLKAEFGN